MKFIAITVAALAGLCSALPGKEELGCQPGTYRCDPKTETGKPGWDVCNTRGIFEFAGYCPPKTVCKFNEVNKSPYCVPWDFEFNEVSTEEDN